LAYTPTSVLDGFTVFLPIQFSSWAADPGRVFKAVAAAGSIVLSIIFNCDEFAWLIGYS